MPISTPTDKALLNLRKTNVPTTEMTTSSKAVHTAAKPAALPAGELAAAICEADTHAMMKEIPTNI